MSVNLDTNEIEIKLENQTVENISRTKMIIDYKFNRKIRKCIPKFTTASLAALFDKEDTANQGNIINECQEEKITSFCPDDEILAEFHEKGSFGSWFGDCFKKASEFHIKDCFRLYRILYALRYYQSLDLNNDNMDKLMYFCDTVYPHLVSDYQHILQTHGDQLEEINKQIIQHKDFGDCNHSQCKLIRRHCRTRDDHNFDNMEDVKLKFYCEVFDSIHHWLYHLFQTGMRTKKSILSDSDDDIMENNQSEYVDQQFRRIRENIVASREKLDIDTDRFNDENNKFTMKVEQQNYFEDDSDGKTFIDTLFENFRVMNIDQEIQQKLEIFLQNERYDTDALIEDIMQLKETQLKIWLDDARDLFCANDDSEENGSNISNIIGNDSAMNIIIGEVQDFKSMCLNYMYLQNDIEKHFTVHNSTKHSIKI